MILLHIKKENREPKVGEWYYAPTIDDYGKAKENDPVFVFYNCKALSLSVILDASGLASHWLKNLNNNTLAALRSYKDYPISNAEEIFQWLHDNGKLGEEWVEWPGGYGGNTENNEITLITEKELATWKEPEYCECKSLRDEHSGYCENCGFDLPNKPIPSSLNEQKGGNKEETVYLNPDWKDILSDWLELNTDNFPSDNTLEEIKNCIIKTLK